MGTCTNLSSIIFLLACALTIPGSAKALQSPTCDYEAQEEKLSALYEKYADATEIDEAVMNDPAFDGDLDCITDKNDNCPQDMNPGQEDWNTDGKGDACTDTDADGYLDYEELANKDDDNPDTTVAPYSLIVSSKKIPINQYTGKTCKPIATHTDPAKVDTDGDGLSDYCENWLPNKTDPVNPDSDCDGITDGLEFGIKEGQLVKDCFKGSYSIIENGEKKKDLILIFGESNAFTPEVPHTNPNAPDPDTDQDGIADKADPTPETPVSPVHTSTNKDKEINLCGAGTASESGVCTCDANAILDKEENTCYPDIDSDGDGLIDAKDNCNGVVDPSNACGGVILDKSTNVEESAADDGGGCSLLARARTRNGTGTMLCGLVTLLAFALARQFRSKP